MIACNRILSLFQLVTRTHDISRQRFVDFELWPVTLELSFSPSCLKMSEDVVAAMNVSSLHVFRLNKGFARASDWSSQAKKQQKSEFYILKRTFIKALLSTISRQSCSIVTKICVLNGFVPLILQEEYLVKSTHTTVCCSRSLFFSFLFFQKTTNRCFTLYTLKYRKLNKEA